VCFLGFVGWRFFFWWGFVRVDLVLFLFLHFGVFLVCCFFSGVLCFGLCALVGLVFWLFVLVWGGFGPSIIGVFFFFFCFWLWFVGFWVIGLMGWVCFLFIGRWWGFFCVVFVFGGVRCLGLGLFVWGVGFLCWWFVCYGRFFVLFDIHVSFVFCCMVVFLVGGGVVFARWWVVCVGGGFLGFVAFFFVFFHIFGLGNKISRY